MTQRGTMICIALSGFQGDGVEWLLSYNRMMLASATTDCGALATQILKKLPHTPIAATGTNFILQDPDMTADHPVFSKTRALFPKVWNHLYPSRAYEPNDDYWYILLRAVAQSKTLPEDLVKFVCMCRTAANRHILEAVLEALNDIGSDEAYAEIESFMGLPEPFIAELASELVSNR